MERQVVCLTPRCDDSAPRAAREAFSRVDDAGWELGDAMLVASELVTNVVRHSCCGKGDLLAVSLYHDGDHLRVSVTDPGASGGAAQTTEDEFAFGGLGLKVVEELTSSWGSKPHGDGYEVWARVPIAS